MIAVALLQLILWLLHAVVHALASAIVDVFTSLTGMLIAFGAVLAVAIAMAGAFGLGGFGLSEKRRRKRAEDL